MKNLSIQPIIVLGGFLISNKSYKPMIDYLSCNINNKVRLIEVSKLEWLKTSTSAGWKNILDKIEKEVSQFSQESETGKVTVIGHSSGGIILRLYLSDEKFMDKKYEGNKTIDHIITLGSPHQAIRATKLRKMVNDKYPGCFYDFINYFSIAGDLNLDSENASIISKLTANGSYKSISGENASKGDGLVPLSSALLLGSKQIILKNVCHGKTFGRNWYFSERITEIWWNKIINDLN